MVGMTGFEPATPRTPCVCATRLRHFPNGSKITGFIIVGVAGFEPATSCSQSRRDDRATLHPEKDEGKYKLSQKQKQSNLYNI